jgi:hypothetical protein
VSDLRRLILTHRRWAALLLFAALALRIMMPAGFMPVATGKTVTIALCTGTGPVPVTLHIPGEPGKGDSHRDGAAQPCAYAALGGPALAAADPALLAAALLFAFVLALLSTDLRLPRFGAYLRPPLRGPPALL